MKEHERPIAVPTIILPRSPPAKLILMIAYLNGLLQQESERIGRGITWQLAFGIPRLATSSERTSTTFIYAKATNEQSIQHFGWLPRPNNYKTRPFVSQLMHHHDDPMDIVMVAHSKDSIITNFGRRMDGAAAADDDDAAVAVDPSTRNGFLGRLLRIGRRVGSGVGPDDGRWLGRFDGR
jgi:hypothetical protein